MSKTLSVCVPLWEIFFNMAYNEFFGPTHTTHGHFFLENRHTQRSLEGGPCAGHMEPTLIFPSGSRRGRAKYDSTKKSRTAGVRSSLRGVSYVSRSAISRPQSAVFDRDFEKVNGACPSPIFGVQVEQQQQSMDDYQLPLHMLVYGF